ncbi:DUF882 domain-containing protein [Rhizobium sp. Root1220]|uniref:DUF882 domain-containing protein n=1 Tax=Rhizobium sp. Root1220 TaxID=1736432 RepID=UPI0006F77953|nr:DUF882 domain-containing protein [Rhizobium sp. Root1220]KQV70153.1 hypothetical protein ASC90_08440 [Rhizobium sp. Root1220]
MAFLQHAFASLPTGTFFPALSFVVHRAVLAAMMLFAAMTVTAQAASDDRALKLFFIHTGERATIVFKRNGKYDPKGLAKINRLLRDWRKNEPTRIDPRLLDLVWEVYQRSAAREPIHVVSAYRSPSTNAALRGRSRSSGVAKRSQHMLGKAMDFYIPGVKLATLRGLAMQMQVGGVGYYPTSGSPFVHLDVGNVRAWPRMSRQELVRLFPSGRTLHLPADGRPLPGYQVAVADASKRSRPVPIDVTGPSDIDDEGAPAPPARDVTGASIVTAMLPTPRSRAADSRFAARAEKSVDGDGKQDAFIDLAAYAAPMPTIRPSLTEEAAIVPAGRTPSLLSQTVLGSRGAGGLHVSAQTGNPTNGVLARMQPIASLPASASQDASSGVGAVSAKALFAWALQPPGTAIDLALPRLAASAIPENTQIDGRATASISDSNDEDFDVERFGFDG